MSFKNRIYEDLCNRLSTEMYEIMFLKLNSCQDVRISRLMVRADILGERDGPLSWTKT